MGEVYVRGRGRGLPAVVVCVVTAVLLVVAAAV